MNVFINCSKKAGGADIAKFPPWPELVDGVDPDQAIQYAITGNFEPGDLIMHKTFGLGRVVTITGLYRAQMSFESGVKVMIQNHGL